MAKMYFISKKDAFKNSSIFTILAVYILSVFAIFSAVSHSSKKNNAKSLTFFCGCVSKLVHYFFTFYVTM